MVLSDSDWVKKDGPSLKVASVVDAVVDEAPVVLLDVVSVCSLACIWANNWLREGPVVPLICMTISGISFPAQSPDTK